MDVCHVVIIGAAAGGSSLPCYLAPSRERVPLRRPGRVADVTWGGR